MRRLEEVVFWREYVGACRTTNQEPPKSLRAQVGRPTLEISRSEGLTLNEWKPLLATLAKDSSLHYIAIGATSTRYKVLEGLVFERDVRGSARRIPCLYSKYVMGCLSTSLSNTVAASKCLTSLLLSKIPIKDQYLNTLCQGLSKTKSLQHLALHHCPVADTGCSLLCKSLASRPTLTTLDLTDCALTHQSAEDLALLIKKQCCVRVSEVWKGSLRYGQPEGDDMPGLRRLTLNLNPAIGDKGVKELTSALQDDIWIKGVDMQGCGISEEGACNVASLLEVNQCLTVFDLRGNPDAAPVLPALMARLRSNLAYSRPGPFKCRWMEEVQPPSARVSQMTLEHSGPPSSRGSVHGSETSIKTVNSNSSEPPWLRAPKKPSLVKKQEPKGRVLKTQSLEVGVHKLRFISIDSPSSKPKPTFKVGNKVNFAAEEVRGYEAADIIQEEETRKPMIAVSKEQYDILKNFKKLTRSFVKAREEPEDGGGDNIPEAPENTQDLTLIEVPGDALAAGDCPANTVLQSSVDSIKPKSELPNKTKRMDAGDATSAAEGEEDYFKERAHQLLRKLIKLRNDRGLERNEGVMRVCSQLSLPESKSTKQTQDLAQPSASFVELSALHKAS